MGRLLAAAIICVLSVAVSPGAKAAECARHDGTALRDVHWRHKGHSHPLIGQVYKGEQPIAVATDTCTRTPLQQLMVEIWGTIRGGGIVLLGEVHDNPEHHAVRGDILWPRLGKMVPTKGLRPAAVFEHIRTGQQAQLDSFYRHAARSRRLWRAPDLLRELAWEKSGWPAAEMFYPLFDAALRAKQPLYPGNAVRERMRVLVRGQDQPTEEEATLLKLAQALPPPLLDTLASELEGSHCGMLPPKAIPGMSLAQRYTDAHLAETLVKAAGKNGGAFLLAGNGHVRTDRGVPWYVRRLAPERRMIAVMFLEVEEGKNDAAAYLTRAPEGAVAADYVMFTPRHERPDPCEKMRQGKPSGSDSGWGGTRDPSCHPGTCCRDPAIHERRSKLRDGSRAQGPGSQAGAWNGHH
jgi:uncharacterized iron-regulated protein